MQETFPNARPDFFKKNELDFAAFFAVLEKPISEETRFQNFRIVRDQQVARMEVFGEIRENSMLPFSARAMKNKESRGIAWLSGFLRDSLGRQGVIVSAQGMKIHERVLPKLPENRIRIIVVEDLRGRVALLSHRLRAPLAHPHAVAIAAPFDRPTGSRAIRPYVEPSALKSRGTEPRTEFRSRKREGVITARPGIPPKREELRNPLFIIPRADFDPRDL